MINHTVLLLWNQIQSGRFDSAKNIAEVFLCVSASPWWNCNISIQCGGEYAMDRRRGGLCGEGRVRQKGIRYMGQQAGGLMGGGAGAEMAEEPASPGNPLYPLAVQESAIHAHIQPGNPRRFIRGEEKGGMGHVLRPAQSAQWVVVDKPVHLLRVLLP